MRESDQHTYNSLPSKTVLELGGRNKVHRLVLLFGPSAEQTIFMLRALSFHLPRQFMLQRYHCQVSDNLIIFKSWVTSMAVADRHDRNRQTSQANMVLSASHHQSYIQPSMLTC
jgi:hypothetical protein